MDSVEGKMTQLRNHLQELATVTIDSEWLKDLIDLGSAAIDIITNIADALGGLEGIIGGIAGVFFQANGFGLLQGKRGTNGEFGKGLVSRIIDSVKQSKKAKTELQNWAKNNGVNTIFSDYIKDASGFNFTTKLSDPSLGMAKGLQEYIAKLGEAKAATMNLQEIQTGYFNSLSLGQKAIQGITSIAGTFISTIATMGLSMLASYAISKGAEAVMNMIHAHENKIKAGKEATQKAEKSQEELRNIKSVNEQAKERYSELRSGVKMDRNVIENISLTNDEYEEFLNLNQQMADAFPSMITGYTDSGQALVDLGTNAEEATEKLKKMYDLARGETASDIKEQLPGISSGIVEQNADLEKEIAQLEANMTAYENYQNFLDKKKNYKHKKRYTADLGFASDENNGGETTAWELFDQALSAAGINNQYGENINGRRLVTFEIEDYKQGDALNKELQRAIGENKIQLGSLQSQIVGKRATQQSNWITNFVPKLIDVIKNDFAYNQVADQLETAVGDSFTNILTNLDYQSMYGQFQKGLAGGFEGEFDDYIFKDIFQNIASALETGEVTDVDLSKLFNFEFGDMTNEERHNELDRIVQALFPDDEELQHTVLIALNYEYVDENDEIHGTDTKERNRFYDLLNGTETKYDQNAGKWVREQGNGFAKFGQVMEVAYEDYMQFLGAVDSGRVTKNANGLFELDGNIINDWEELLAVIDKLKQPLPEEPSVGTLADIFNDETFSDSASKIESNISTLQGALDNFKESGKLTSDQLKDLFEEIPELADFGEDLTMEDIGNQMLKNALSFSKAFNEAMDRNDLSDSAKKAATNYMETFWDQMATVAVSKPQAEKALYDFMVGAVDTTEKSQMQQATKYHDVMDALQEYYGGDIDWSVVISLLADPSMADATTQEWIAAVEGQEAKIKIIADLEEAKTELDKFVESKQSEIDAQQAYISAKEAKPGEYVTKEDWDPIIAAQASIVGENREYYEQAAAAYDDAVKNRSMYSKSSFETIESNMNSAYADWQNSLSSLYDFQKNGREAQLNYLNEMLAEHEAIGERLENEQTNLTNDGRRIDSKLASQIAQNRQNQAQAQEDVAAEAERLYRTTGESSYLNTANAARQSAYELRQRSSAQQIIDEQQVTMLQNSYEDLQATATEIQDAITLQEGQGLKPTLDQYRALVENGEKQLQNLEDQNYYLTRQQNHLRGNYAMQREIGAQIRSNNSAISAMRGNLAGWENNIKDYAADIGSSLLSVLQTAFDESISKSGLQPTTMRELAAQFEGIEGFDYADMFYNTAEGVKLDTRATERLVDAQYSLMTGDLTQRITDQTNALANLKNEYLTTSDAARKMEISQEMDLGQANLDQLYNQLAQYHALYAQAHDLFSARGDWQRAQQTENAGAEYSELQGYLQTQEEAYTSGLIGTDDFKAYTAIFDEWGRNTLQAYTDNRDKIKRYLTDDNTGPANVLNDLVAAGYGTKTDEGVYSLDLPDLAEASHALGISQEFLDYALQRTEDYGFINDYVSSEIQGQLKLEEVTQDLGEIIRKRNEALAQGAPQDVIDDYNNQISQLETTRDNVRENIQDVVAREGKISAGEIKAASDTINEYRKQMDKATTQGEKNAFRRMMENVAEEAGLSIDGLGNIIYPDEYKGWKHALDQQKKADDIKGSQIEKQTEGLKLEDESAEATETLSSAVGKLSEGWDTNTEKVQEYLDQLQNADVDKLKDLDLNDGKVVDGLEKEEAALDGLKNAFGLTADEAQLLVPILQELGLIGQGAQTLYDRVGQGEVLGVKVSGVEDILKGTEYEGVTNFDPAIMSAEQLQAKIQELSNAKAKINVETEGGEEAVNQMTELQAACQKELETKVKVESTLEESGMTIDKFLGLSEIEKQDYLASVGIEANTDEYDAFVAECEGRSIRAQVEAVLSSDSEVTLHDLARMDEEHLSQYIDVNGNYDQVHNEIQAMERETVELTVQLSTDSLSGITDAVSAALEGETYEAHIKGDVDEVTKAIETTVKKEHVVDVTANVTTRQAPAPVQAALSQPTISSAPRTSPGDFITTGFINYQTGNIAPIPPQEADVDYSIGEQEEPVDKTATVNYVSGYDMSQQGIKEQTINVKYSTSNQPDAQDQTANVNYTLGSQETPEPKDTTVNYSEMTQTPPEDQEAGVHYNHNGQDPAHDDTASVYYNYGGQTDPQNRTATVKYIADTSGLTTSLPPIIRRVILQETKQTYTGTMTSISSHAKGTVGDLDDLPTNIAKARGDVAIKKDEDSLVNELGQESIIY